MYCSESGLCGDLRPVIQSEVKSMIPMMKDDEKKVQRQRDRERNAEPQTR